VRRLREASRRVTMLIGVDDLSIENNWVLTSPRSIEACRATGIEPTELIERPVKSFIDNYKKTAVASLRYDAHVRYRNELARLVSKVRRPGLIPPPSTAFSV